MKPHEKVAIEVKQSWTVGYVRCVGVVSKPDNIFSFFFSSFILRIHFGSKLSNERSEYFCYCRLSNSHLASVDESIGNSSLQLTCVD